MKHTILHLLEKDFYARQTYMQQEGSAVIEQLIENVGNPNEQLRNNYVQLFIELLSNDLITNEQKITLINSLANQNGLFYQVGELKTDTVFTRAYSAFYIMNLLQEDIVRPFLAPTEASKIIENCLTYLSKELDIRAYIEDKGWANAIYFGANLSVIIVQHPSFEEKYSPILLQGIKDCFWKGEVFSHDEEEQLVKIIECLISKNINEDMLIEWVEQVFDKLNFYVLEQGYTPLYYATRTNILHFMKTLYFTLKFSNKMQELKGVTSIFIGKSMN